MIRAIYRDGIIYPEEPVPLELQDGQEVRVEWDYSDPSNDPQEIDRWDAEWRAVGPMHYEPGEREQFQRTLEEADRIAKDFVRRRMESGQ